MRRGEQRKRKHDRSVPSCVVHVRLFGGYAVCAWLGVACVTPLGDSSAFYEASRRVSDEAANIITCTTSRLSDLVVIMRSCDSNRDSKCPWAQGGILFGSSAPSTARSSRVFAEMNRGLCL